MHNIIMIGPQGSGKGTQADLLARKLRIPHVSLGTLLRTEVANGTELGRTLSSYTDRGEIVPIEIVTEVLKKRLSASDTANGVILDGYPRTRAQEETLESIMSELGRKITDAISLNITDEEAMKRLSGRRVCANVACERNYHIEYHPTKMPGRCDECGSPVVQRKDDVPDAIKRRLEIFHAETKPLIALYAAEGVLREIDGMHMIDEVQAAIRAVFGV